MYVCYRGHKLELCSLYLVHWRVVWTARDIAVGSHSLARFRY